MMAQRPSQILFPLVTWSLQYLPKSTEALGKEEFLNNKQFEMLTHVNRCSTKGATAIFGLALNQNEIGVVQGQSSTICECGSCDGFVSFSTQVCTLYRLYWFLLTSFR